LQEICDPRANAAQKTLKKVLLDIYGKSGWNSLLRPSVYSDIDKNTAIVQAPNVTIIGESTPENFYAGIDQSHIAEGLIPRFLIVEYNGPRPPRNQKAFFPPSEEVLSAFTHLVTIGLSTQQNGVCAPVQVTPEAERILNRFDVEADKQINSSSADIQAQLWNRAHLKSLKLAGLVAVGVNPDQPIVDELCATWAMEMVRKDISYTMTRFNDGDMGQGANKQEAEVRNAVNVYMSMNEEERRVYKVPEALVGKQGFIPYAFLRRWLRLRGCFKADKIGSTSAIQKCLDDMVKAEALVQVPPNQARTEFNTTAAVYGLGSNW
jgi:hypothetical protein